ncbi:MAG: ferredoxin family protein [Candidatus Hodarchaeota archaeon]
MPIDRSFQTTWKRKGTHEGHTVWASTQAQLGIHGTRVAVDFDSCTGCLKCFAVCPVEVFIKWKAQPQTIKADPVNETACLECLACELVCPVDAIYITRNPPHADTLSALLD